VPAAGRASRLAGDPAYQGAAAQAGGDGADREGGRGMGKSAAETVREIEETRERLDADITELQERLPAPAVWGKRLLGVVFGWGVAGSLFWFGVRRLRKRRKEEKARREAVQAVVQVGPERWAEALSG